MKRTLLGLGTVVLLAAGCATSSQDLQAKAAEHQRRADDYAAQGDYSRAQKEQKKADKLTNRAALDRTGQQFNQGVTNLPPGEKRLDVNSYPDGELPNYDRPPEVRQ